MSEAKLRLVKLVYYLRLGQKATENSIMLISLKHLQIYMYKHKPKITNTFASISNL